MRPGRVVLPGGSHMPTIEEYFERAKMHRRQRSSARSEAVHSGRRRGCRAGHGYGPKNEYHRLNTPLLATGWLRNSTALIQMRRFFSSKTAYLFMTLTIASQEGYDAISYDMNGLMNHPDYVREPMNSEWKSRYGLSTIMRWWTGQSDMALIMCHPITRS